MCRGSANNFWRQSKKLFEAFDMGFGTGWLAVVLWQPFLVCCQVEAHISFGL